MRRDLIVDKLMERLTPIAREWWDGKELIEVALWNDDINQVAEIINRRARIRYDIRLLMYTEIKDEDYRRAIIRPFWRFAALMLEDDVTDFIQAEWLLTQWVNEFVKLPSREFVV